MVAETERKHHLLPRKSSLRRAAGHAAFDRKVPAFYKVTMAVDTETNKKPRMFRIMKGWEVRCKIMIRGSPIAGVQKVKHYPLNTISQFKIIISHLFYAYYFVFICSEHGATWLMFHTGIYESAPNSRATAGNKVSSSEEESVVKANRNGTLLSNGSSSNGKAALKFLKQKLYKLPN